MLQRSVARVSFTAIVNRITGKGEIGLSKAKTASPPALKAASVSGAVFLFQIMR
jgi:hypothetical protein